MATKQREFIPALNRRWLTPMYDLFMRLLTREAEFKQRLVDLADPRPGRRILDLGCGTGTLTLMIQTCQSEVDIVGLDADPEVLAIAQQKALQADQMNIHWTRGFTANLPYLGGVFDLVVISMVLHHLTLSQKRETLREVMRVLSPAGIILLADFDKPRGVWMRLVTTWMRRYEHTAEHFDGQLPGLLAEAGFTSIEELDSFNTIFGRIAIQRAIIRS